MVLNQARCHASLEDERYIDNDQAPLKDVLVVFEVTCWAASVYIFYLKNLIVDLKESPQSQKQDRQVEDRESNGRVLVTLDHLQHERHDHQR